MAKKRKKAVKKRVVKKGHWIRGENVIKDIEENLEETAEEVEKWIIERRKFFKKLAWVAGIIILLLVLSHFYLRVHIAGF